METKTLLKVNAVLFGLVALAHLYRVLLGKQVLISTLEIPEFASIIAIIIAVWLCWQNWKA